MERRGRVFQLIPPRIEIYNDPFDNSQNLSARSHYSRQYESQNPYDRFRAPGPIQKSNTDSKLGNRNDDEGHWAHGRQKYRLTVKERSRRKYRSQELTPPGESEDKKIRTLFRRSQNQFPEQTESVHVMEYRKKASKKKTKKKAVKGTSPSSDADSVVKTKFDRVQPGGLPENGTHKVLDPPPEPLEDVSNNLIESKSFYSCLSVPIYGPLIVDRISNTSKSSLWILGLSLLLFLFWAYELGEPIDRIREAVTKLFETRHRRRYRLFGFK